MEMNKRTKKSMSADRISMLPDEMISKVLNLLPVEEAVRTGVLSKRWKNVWARTSDLEYCYYQVEGEREGRLEEFLEFVIQTTIRHHGIIRRLSLKFCYNKDVIFQVHSVLSNAKKKKVEELHLESVNDEELEDDYIKFYDLLRGLTIGCWGVEVLSVGKLKKWFYPSSERRQLTLHAYLSLTSLPGIASALQTSPNLEKLVIHLITESQTLDFDPDFIYEPVEETYLEEMSVFHCLSEHLKTLEIFGFSRVGTNDILPGLLRSLLEKSMVLETMVIYKDAIHPANLIYVEEEILNFPKSSSQAIVRFQLAK